MINLYGDLELKMLLPAIAQRVETLCTDVYGEFYPISLQIQAWLMRGEDPEKILQKSINNIYDSRNEHNSMDLKKSNSVTLKQTKQFTKEYIFLNYHCLSTSKRYDKIIKIEAEEILDKNALTKMQLIILKYLYEKEIVIETLPTSNVIIGHHHSFNTYHLYNWYKWRNEGYPIPPILLGTDDAGIFATNIYNEYCNIYCQLVYTKKMNLNDVIHFIREIDYNSELYKFT